MYITYCRNQKSVDLEDKTSYRLSVTGGEYRPNWLVRISDWKIVPGSEAENGYHTLSYCWEQSGEVFKRMDGNGYDLIDNGEHCIVENYNFEEDYIVKPGELPDTKEEDSKYITWCIPTCSTTKIKYVRYEQLVQQLCKDLQVEYLWYDKLCIDQSNKKEKLREIKQMHKIYQNARYIIAMIPEARASFPEDFDSKMFQYVSKARSSVMEDIISRSSWMKRSWTLEEVMMARRILVVGTDTNFFQHSLHTTDRPGVVDIFSNALLDFRNQKNGGSVNQALREAHFRTSTKPHDMMFALANTFAHMFDEIETNYQTDVQTTFNNFYRHAATKELSMLCFGSILSPDGDIALKHTMDDYSLPSWTGIDGYHTGYRVDTTIHPQSTQYVDDKTMRMHITTNHYWNISITPFNNGCFSPALKNNSDRDATQIASDHFTRINAGRWNDQWTDMSTADKDTVLIEWLVNMNVATECYMTHYHQRQGSLTQLRPLSLTEDCEKCIILPILLRSHMPGYKQVDKDRSNFIIESYIQGYFLPVFRECSNKSTDGQLLYKAIGIYFVGEDQGAEKRNPTFSWNHCVGRDDIEADEDPEKILNILFKNDSHSDVPKKFVIE